MLTTTSLEGASRSKNYIGPRTDLSEVDRGARVDRGWGARTVPDDEALRQAKLQTLLSIARHRQRTRRPAVDPIMAMSNLIMDMEAADGLVDDLPRDALSHLISSCWRFARGVGRDDLDSLFYAIARAFSDHDDGRDVAMLRPLRGHIEGEKPPPLRERTAIDNAILVLHRMREPPLSLPRKWSAEQVSGVLQKYGFDVSAQQLIDARKRASQARSGKSPASHFSSRTLDELPPLEAGLTREQSAQRLLEALDHMLSILVQNVR